MKIRVRRRSFYKDKVRFSCVQRTRVRKVLRTYAEILEEACDDFTFKQNHEFKKSGIIATAVNPRKKFFKILASKEEELGKYHVCETEIACDFILGTREQTIEFADEVPKIISVNYLPIYEVISRGPKDKIDDEKYGPRCHYFKSKSEESMLVIYPRMAKQYYPKEKLPSVHFEFRFKQTANIKKKIGINTFSELAVVNVKNLFIDLFLKHVTFCQIDHLVHARFLANNIPIKVLNDLPVFKQRFLAESFQFCERKGFINSTQLKFYYNEKKKKLIQRIKEGYKITAEDVKILKFNIDPLNKVLEKEKYLFILFGEKNYDNIQKLLASNSPQL